MGLVSAGDLRQGQEEITPRGGGEAGYFHVFIGNLRSIIKNPPNSPQAFTLLIPSRSQTGGTGVSPVPAQTTSYFKTGFLCHPER